MNDIRSTTQSTVKTRKVRLSPDIAELVDMLNALDMRNTSPVKPN